MMIDCGILTPFLILCCLSSQSERYPGLPAQAEEDGPVLGHPDPGAGEAGESGPEEPRTYHCQGEGRGRHRHPEDSRKTLQLLLRK